MSPSTALPRPSRDPPHYHPGAAAEASGAKKVKCLVTGGAGFLGKHLVNRLVESGRYEARGSPGQRLSARGP